MPTKQEREKMIDDKQNIAVDSSHNSDRAPNMTRIGPVLRILSYEDAVAYYVDWLGFTIDWEWRETPGRTAHRFCR